MNVKPHAKTQRRKGFRLEVLYDAVDTIFECRRDARILFFTMLLLSMLPRLALGSDGEGVLVPANVSQEAWDVLLKKYVNDHGLVAYADWKKNQTDLDALDSYLKQFADKPQTPATGNDEAASLINLYNATTIR